MCPCPGARVPVDCPCAPVPVIWLCVRVPVCPWIARVPVIWLCVRVPVDCPCARVPVIWLCVRVPVCPWIACVPVCRSRPISPSHPIPAHPSIRSIYLSTYLPSYLSVCLSLSLSPPPSPIYPHCGGCRVYWLNSSQALSARVAAVLWLKRGGRASGLHLNVAKCRNHS